MRKTSFKLWRNGWWPCSRVATVLLTVGVCSVCSAPQLLFCKNKLVFTVSGCIFSDIREIFRFLSWYLQYGAVFNFCLKISQSGQACTRQGCPLLFVHVWGAGRTGITCSREPPLLCVCRFRRVAVSSQLCKRARRDLSTSEKKPHSVQQKKWRATFCTVTLGWRWKYSHTGLMGGGHTIESLLSSKGKHCWFELHWYKFTILSYFHDVCNYQSTALEIKSSEHAVFECISS